MARERKFSTAELFRETKQILLARGYEAFTLSQLAEQLNVSRGTIYKYYANKDELITSYMIYEMDQFLVHLNEIDKRNGFFAQFEYLMDLVFQNDNIDQLIEIGRQVSSGSKKVKQNKEDLRKLHLKIYDRLHRWIRLGRKEGVLKDVFQCGRDETRSGLDRGGQGSFRAKKLFL